MREIKNLSEITVKKFNEVIATAKFPCRCYSVFSFTPACCTRNRELFASKMFLQVMKFETASDIAKFNGASDEFLLKMEVTDGDWEIAGCIFIGYI